MKKLFAACLLAGFAFLTGANAQAAAAPAEKQSAAYTRNANRVYVGPKYYHAKYTLDLPSGKSSILRGNGWNAALGYDHTAKNDWYLGADVGYDDVKFKKGHVVSSVTKNPAKGWNGELRGGYSLGFFSNGTVTPFVSFGYNTLEVKPTTTAAKMRWTKETFGVGARLNYAVTDYVDVGLGVQAKYLAYGRLHTAGFPSADIANGKFRMVHHWNYAFNVPVRFYMTEDWDVTLDLSYSDAFNEDKMTTGTKRLREKLVTTGAALQLGYSF